MACQITNNSDLDIKGFDNVIRSLVSFSQDRFGFKKLPSLFLQSDSENAEKMLGKTAYYDPAVHEIHIFVDGRHSKDILRSIAHEIIHHVQNLRGDLDGDYYHGEGYAQKDKHMRKMEKEAYLEGNMLFRDFEDRKEMTIYKEWRTNKMSLKEWKNKELFTLLSSKWGFAKNVVSESDDKEITHMCALKVTHKGSGQVGHPYKHTLTESGDISHYSVEFDDVLVENIAVEDLDIMVQKEHMHAKKDEKPHAKDKPVVSEEELEEMHCPSGKKDDEMNEDPNRPIGALKKQLKDSGMSDEEIDEMSDDEIDKKAAMLRLGKPSAVALGESEEIEEMHCPSGKKDDELEEGAKPDFLDLDGDGDKEEPMKKAAKEKKEKEAMDEELDEMHCPSKSKKDDEDVRMERLKRLREMVKEIVQEMLDE